MAVALMMFLEELRIALSKGPNDAIDPIDYLLLGIGWVVEFRKDRSMTEQVLDVFCLHKWISAIQALKCAPLGPLLASRQNR
jgi:hypothetical protein